MTTEQVNGLFQILLRHRDKFESAFAFETIKKHSHAETVTIIEIKAVVQRPNATKKKEVVFQMNV